MLDQAVDAVGDEGEEEEEDDDDDGDDVVFLHFGGLGVCLRVEERMWVKNMGICVMCL